jgi:sulfur-carrier protein
MGHSYGKMKRIQSTIEKRRITGKLVGNRVIEGTPFMVKVIIPAPLRRYAQEQEALDLEGKTVQELLANLVGTYSDLKKHLYTEEGKLRNFVNVYVNDEDIRHLQQENTPITEGAIVSIVPSIAGG